MRSPAALGQGCGGAHADGEHHKVSGDALAALQANVYASVGAALELGDAFLQVEGYPLVRQMLVYGSGEGVVNRCHDLSGHLDDGDPDPGVPQVLGHLQPDEACTHDDGVLDAPAGEAGLDAVGVFHVAQGEDVVEVYAFQWRPDGCCSGRQ